MKTKFYTFFFIVQCFSNYLIAQTIYKNTPNEGTFLITSEIAKNGDSMMQKHYHLYNVSQNWEFKHTVLEVDSSIKDDSINKYRKLEKTIPSSKVHAFLTVGYGIGLINESISHNFGLSFGITYKKSLFSTRFISGKEFNWMFHKCNPFQKTRNFGLLYGRTLTVGNVIFSASSGVSYNNGDIHSKLLSREGGFLKRGTYNYENSTYQSFGIPFELGIMLGNQNDTFFNFIIFLDINPNFNTGGVMACLRFGKANINNKIK